MEGDVMDNATKAAASVVDNGRGAIHPGLLLFMKEASSVPPLCAKEEHRLVGLAKGRGMAAMIARNTVIRHNLSLVVYEAEKSDGHGSAVLMKLLEAGTEALIVAVNDFDEAPQHGKPFRKFATGLIENAIQCKRAEMGQAAS